MCVVTQTDGELQMTLIRTCEFQSGVSEKTKTRRMDGVLRTSNTTALITCICVVNVKHRHGTCEQDEVREG